MAFDFKKEYKEFYMPKNKPEIVNVPTANYIAVRGKGNPNTPDDEYQQAISVLYESATINWTGFLRAYTMNPYEERNFNYVREKTTQTAAYLYARIQTAAC